MLSKNGSPKAETQRDNGKPKKDPTHIDTLAELLNNNREWATSMRVANPGLLEKLAKAQTPEILWIDAVDVLKVKHCGGCHSAMSNKQYGLIDNWLRNIKDIYTSNREKLQVLPQSEQTNVLIELNVAKSVLNICHTTIVQNAWDRGQELSVHGWVYQLEDGLIQDLSLCVNKKDEIDEIYAYVTNEVVKTSKRDRSSSRRINNKPNDVLPGGLTQKQKEQPGVVGRTTVLTNTDM
ncbi:hypothetical protein HK100_000855 [Physocladia obscura]|uniref:Carbonic anhydrase n=1 Tax=Physocladia obscura TaxID=109957 RepID=A0AAD5SZH6_9FUNG|nr:hypothetical protein HK100_000855 [Physocladia obscura]